jgi:hypothetical protein
MGHLADSQDTSWAGIKRAMVFGSVIASFAVETFGPDGLMAMKREEIDERFETLRQCTMFEALPAAVAGT